MDKHGSTSQQWTAFALLTLEFHKEGRLWVGVCRELGTAADGRAIEQVAASLTKLVELEIAELGELERVFEQHGIRRYTGELSEPVAPSLPLSAVSTKGILQVARLSLPAARRESAAGVGG